MATPVFNLLDTAIGDRVLDGPTIAALLAESGEGSVAVGNSVSFLKTASGASTILAAAAADRVVNITVHIDTTFADGDGAQPTFSIGQTGSATKFAATSAFTGKTAGTGLSFGGILSAGDALIVTATAGTGTTETGALTVTGQATAKGT